MKTKELEKALEGALAGCEIEHLEDQPGEDVVVLRIETPFFNFKIDQRVTMFAYYRENDNLLQLSDRGLYSFCIGTEERTTINMKRHRNFIRASGHILMSSESEDGSFVVNSPTINLDAEDLDLPLFIGHYLSLLLYCGEV